MVVTGLPATSDIWVWHENARLPSMCTMQAPHRPVPQPNFVPVSLRSSRITHNNGVIGGALLEAALPFTVKLMAMVALLPDYPRRASSKCANSAHPLAPFAIGHLLFCSSQLTQCCLDPCRIERQVADALARRAGEGIGNGGDRRAL